MDIAEALESPGRGGCSSPLPPGRPLFVTGDDALLDALLRLAAAAGVTPEVALDEVAVRRSWTSASLVVVAGDAAARVAAGAPARRRGVVVVTRGPSGLADWQHSVAIGAEQVLTLPDDEAVLAERLAEAADDAGGRAVLSAAVVGGCGGAGASVFAAALAVTAAGQASRALLLDADPLGGGLDLVLGSEAVPGVRWPELLNISGRVSASALRGALPQVGALSVLSWDRGDVAAVDPTVMREVLAAARRGHDVVVVDLPRWLDPAGEEVLLQADRTYLVVPAEVRAVAAAVRVAARLRAMTGRAELVVRGPGPTGLDGPLVAESLDLPLAAEMRAERGLDAVLDAGEGLCRRRRGPLARACRAVLERELTPRGSGA